MGTGWSNSKAVVSVAAVLLLFASCQQPPQSKLQPSAGRAPATPALPRSPPRREAIFFIKGDATLSPGAITKLKLWVDTWGLRGTWTLACPTGPGLTYELLEKRLLAIRAELQKLGLPKVATTLLPSGPGGQYDAIYVMKEPF